jgi:phospholipase C
VADDDRKLGDASQTRVTRRRFLQDVATGVGAVGLGGLGPMVDLAAKPHLPKPGHSGIEHIVVLMMENRSFDHFLGWLPGADGRQAGLTYLDRAGQPQSTHPLAPDYQGCGQSDPDHSYAGGRVEYNNGACDGWLRAGSNDAYSIGYYTQSDLSFLGQAAPSWTTCDRYFAAIMAETFPNRVYQHAAQTDRLDNSLALSTLPTIWDRLAERGLRGRYYFNDVPFLALWGAKYLSIGRPFGAFLADCATGSLPEVSFVDPRFIDEQSGTSNDDHPHADIRNGEAFLNLVYSAVALSPAWPNTVLIINYDEWGGFFEHVPPSAAPIPDADRSAGNEDGLRGFRVPCVIVSPFARRAFVASTVFDHTSVLRLIEWRWDLEPLTERDATAANIADVLDFKARNQRPPLFPVPPGPFGAACPAATAPLLTSTTAETETWMNVRDIARIFGWPVNR